MSLARRRSRDRPPRWALLALGLTLGACRKEDAPKQPPASRPHVPGTALPIAAPVATRPDHVPAGTSCLTSGCHANLQATAYIHGPIAVGNCDSCHGPEQTGHKFPLAREGDALCTRCHVVLTGKPVVHAALTQKGPDPARSGCLACHAPHGSQTKFLLAAATLEANCRSCHPATETGAVRHGPFAAGACTLCHSPHESDNKKLTLRSGPDHCTRCHADVGERIKTSRTPHPPAQQDCTTCHEPHAAPHAGLLRAEGATLCVECHATQVEKARTAIAPHGAIFTDKECLNCHDVHGSAQPALLKQRMPEVCLACHEKPQVAYDGRTIPEMRSKLVGAEFLHGPIRAGDCQLCHNAHGSTNTRLLKKAFPEPFYLEYDVAQYALCFSCHDQAIVADARTDKLTGFRNGDLNLHYLHVRQLDRGRSCKACHEIHGSNQPAHMADAVPFDGGGWALPIRFKKSETGGGCAPGCHQPYEYDRVNPVTIRRDPSPATWPASRPSGATP